MLFIKVIQKIPKIADDLFRMTYAHERVNTSSAPANDINEPWRDYSEHCHVPCT